MLIDYPKYCSLTDYQNAIDEMVSVLSEYEGIYSVFQVGGLSTPGISDIDFFVVFEDDIKCTKQPLSQISAQSRYLFTHSLFGTSKKYANSLEQYTLFKNYKLLWGNDFDVKENYKSPSNELLIQIALEYLFKMYLTQQIELKYKTYGVRNFLLLAKAIDYDLKLMKVENGSLRQLCDQVLQLRDNWFQNPINAKELRGIITDFRIGVHNFLVYQLKLNQFYLPANFKSQFARNMRIEFGVKLDTEIKGIAPAPNLGRKILGTKYPKLLNRMVDFKFKIPFKNNDLPVEINDRFIMLNQAAQYNKQYLPNFSCTGYPLNIF